MNQRSDKNTGKVSNDIFFDFFSHLASLDMIEIAGIGLGMAGIVQEVVPEDYFEALRINFPKKFNSKRKLYSERLELDFIRKNHKLQNCEITVESDLAIYGL